MLFAANGVTGVAGSQGDEMWDDPGFEGAAFDFDELANHLLEQGHDQSPSHLHGCLSGLLAAGAAPEPELGLALLAQALGLDLYGELADQSMQLYRVTAAAMEDEEFDFHPLLRDDDEALALRTGALGAWCAGFLAGYNRFREDTPGQELAEIPGDIAAISEATMDEEAGEDESEGSYLEIVEYLRFAVLNAYMENREGTEARTPPALH